MGKWKVIGHRTIFVVVMASLSACGTVSALQSSTLSQGSTSTDIVNQMVLDNLAMAKEEGKVLPWHIKITQGSIGVTDSATPNASYVWPTIARTIGLTGTRSWALTWTIVPELDPTVLDNLEDFYNDKANVHFPSDVLGVGPAPSGQPSGKYGHTTVYVIPGKMSGFSEIVRQVLAKAPVTAPERGIQLPVPIAPGH